jgi:hypothetical protein
LGTRQMKTTCPACGATASLDALLGHEGAREAVMVALALPAPLGKLLVQYVALFRPASRNLSMDRLASLLRELQPLIAEAKIERGGRNWSAPLEYWQMALTDIVSKRDKLTLPLKSHGYLLEIIAGFSNKAEAKQEAQSEAKRGGQTQVGGQRLPSVDEVLGKKTNKPRSAIPAEVLAMVNAKSKTGGNDANT